MLFAFKFQRLAFNFKIKLCGLHFISKQLQLSLNTEPQQQVSGIALLTICQTIGKIHIQIIVVSTTVCSKVNFETVLLLTGMSTVY